MSTDREEELPGKVCMPPTCCPVTSVTATEYVTLGGGRAVSCRESDQYSSIIYVINDPYSQRDIHNLLKNQQLKLKGEA